MDGELKKNLLAVCAALEHWDVRYMFVGGTAVALHGYYRHSMGPGGQLSPKPDIDLWFEPTYANYFGLLNMLETMGCDVLAFKNEQHPDPMRSFFKLDMDEFTLDALPRIHTDIQFADAYARKEIIDLDGIPIHYIGFDDLVEDKKRSARPKDQADLEQLKRHRGQE
jgi:hypothetical protein